MPITIAITMDEAAALIEALGDVPGLEALYGRIVEAEAVAGGDVE